jgi:hypothetical protein
VARFWNLKFLLIKPVQRVLKYPLLLKDSLSCTPTDHPDFAALRIACKEMSFVVGGINEVKRRKGMVQSIVSHKRNETGIQHAINKGFSRRTEKLKRSVGLSDTFVDKMYDKLVENDIKHCAQVEVIARDIETYVQELQGHVDRFIRFSSSIKGFSPQPAPKNPVHGRRPRRLLSHNHLTHNRRVRLILSQYPYGPWAST